MIEGAPKLRHPPEDNNHNDDYPEHDHQPTLDDDQDNEPPLDGSQYTSEGKEFCLQDYESYEDGNPDPAIGFIGIAAMDSQPQGTNRYPIERIIGKSTTPKPRPCISKKETRPLMVKVNIGGLDAITLIDTGSTLDAITPEFAELSKQKLFEFSESLPLQLGCKGSRSKTSFGAESQLKLGPIDHLHYWDVVNLDKYDAILGIPAMNKYSIVADPANGRIPIKDHIFSSLTEEEEQQALAR
jgi:hypothetical protein